MKTYCTSYSKRESIVSRPSITANEQKGGRRSNSPDYISVDPNAEVEEARRRLHMKEKLAQYGRIDITSNKGQVHLQK